MKKNFVKKRWIYSFSFLAIVSLVNFACRKPTPEIPKKESIVMTASAVTPINLWEVYRRLPQTIAHNLADSLKLDMTKMEWMHRQDGLLTRIPTTAGRNKWLYVFQPYNDPTDIKVYAVIFYPEDNSRVNFNGKQIWIDLQDWYLYGVTYANNVAVSFLEPQRLADRDWESCMMGHGDFYLEANGNINIRDEEQQAGTGLKPTGPGIPCPDNVNGSGKSLWGSIGDYFRDLSVGSGTADFGNGGPDNWLPPSDLGGGPYGGSGGPGPYMPPDEDPDYTTYPPNEAGDHYNTPNDPGQLAPSAWVVEGPLSNNGQQVVGVDNPTVAFVGGILGLNQQQRNWLLQHLDKASNIQVYLLSNIPDLTLEQKKDMAREHLQMMMENQDYLNQINNLTGNWWDVDQNGFVTARKIQMDLYLQANPQGMLDCNELATLPMNMYQDVGSYQVPQSVLNRISTLRDQNAPAYNTSNFRIKPIQEGSGGLVNCDYFYIKINSLPYLNNVQMTADQFLEYFRTHFNSFISPNIGVSFEPYIDYVAGSVNINETTKFNSSYENSLGSLVHIAMAQDGTVVESGYSRNNLTNHHSFTFTTMYTPLDGNHPVAGNRRWGIFQSGSSYYFYILGVDRTNDFATTLVNVVDIAFDGADDLWHNVQSNMLDFCDTHQGDAFMAEEKISRPEWDDVKQFLEGHISLQQYKANLHCP